MTTRRNSRNNNRRQVPSSRGRSKAVRRPKRRTTLGSRIKRQLRSIKRTWKNRIRRNKGKFTVVVLALVAILAVVILHGRAPVERIEQGDYEHSSMFDDCIVVDGIDVSYAQGGDIDWNKAKKAGVDFVFIRAGYRGSTDGKLHEDECFQDNIKGAEKAGLMIGAYFFSQAVSKKEAREEANYLVSLVDGYDMTMPLVMDYETYGSGRLASAISKGKLGITKMSNIVLAFTDTVEKAGYDSCLYANLSFLTNTLAGGDLTNYTNIWVAQYNRTCDFGYDYQFWQCTDKEQVAGLSGNVDKDFWYIDKDGVIKTGPRDSERTSISGFRVELSKHSVSYLGKPVKPGVEVYNGSDKLREGTDYYVSYIKNTEAGKGYVVISGIGEYKDKLATSFRIKGNGLFG